MPKKTNTVNFITKKPKNTAKYREVVPSSLKPKVTKKVKPLVKKSKPRSMGGFKFPINNTKSSHENLPKASLAGKIVDKMPDGSRNLTSKKSADKRMSPRFVIDKKSNRPAKAKSQERKTKPVMVTQPPKRPNKMVMPTDAPSVPVWESIRAGIKVMESVVMTINGKPKLAFPIISNSMMAKLVESYGSCGYKVKFLQQDNADWKNDKLLIDYVYECVDAHFNGLYETSKKMYDKARRRLAGLCEMGNNNLCESKNHEFERMVTAASNKIHEAVAMEYLDSLMLTEGVVRMQKDGNIMDVDIQTYAHNHDMALRNFRNEIIEAYGFNTKILHVFIDGDKFNGEEVMKM